ncbi:hypothetical protein, partial [Xanthomonas campestris]|uniref:hypothetical protein n=1 Tax=Xanthomonas campestris TaxID=339 RepID=UPI003556595A
MNESFDGLLDRLRSDELGEAEGIALLAKLRGTLQDRGAQQEGGTQQDGSTNDHGMQSLHLLAHPAPQVVVLPGNRATIDRAFLLPQRSGAAAAVADALHARAQPQ